MYTETYSLSFSVLFAIHKAKADFMALAGTDVVQIRIKLNEQSDWFEHIGWA